MYLYVGALWLESLPHQYDVESVRLWAEACIGPAGGTRMGTIDRKRPLKLANGAPDSFGVAQAMKEHQAQVKVIALVINELFWD